MHNFLGFIKYLHIRLPIVLQSLSLGLGQGSTALDHDATGRLVLHPGRELKE